MSRRGPARGRGPTGPRGCGLGNLPARIPGSETRPAPTGAERQPQLPVPLRPLARPPPSTIWKSTVSESDTSKIPQPLRPPSPSRAAFLPRRFREGERIPRTKSAGKTGEGEGGGRVREPLPRFFFFFQQKESTRFFPSSKSWQARGTEAQQRQPQNGGRPPPSARARGVPRQAHGAPALWGQVFPGNPGAPVALRDRNALWRTRCPAGAFQRAGPGGRGAGSGAPLVSGSGTPYLPSG